MSCIVEFAMFPTDLGESVSKYVSKIVQMLNKSDIRYELTPMGTVYECDNIKDALKVIEDSYEVIEPFSNRIYVTVKFDIRKNRINGMSQKVESIKKKI